LIAFHDQPRRFMLLLNMLLLAADTSGKNGSIALARGHEVGSCDVIEVMPLERGTFSAQLVPQIAALLVKHGFTKSDIGGFTVASGPGSFTGLRVGLAAMKALAEILAKPITAVSLLEALALACGVQGRIVAILDAGRGEIYAGEYEISGESATLLRERVSTVKELLTEGKPVTVVTPEAAVADTVRAAGWPVKTVSPLTAADIARVGWRKVQSGITVTPEQLEANYIRRSDAEIFAKGSHLRA
jgi:tRNA threonylcarbamoyladenosine biosynthesis protein TsaB